MAAARRPPAGFVDFVVERMAFVPDVRAHAMFGGHGLYAGERMFAIVIGETLYLKADAAVRRDFDARGLAPFAYEAKGRRVTVGYREAPPEVFDDADAMREWVARSLGAAARGAAVKRKPPAR